MKILLLQLKRIGDLVLTLPAIAALRQKFPDAQITLVVTRQCAELLPAITDVDVGFVARRSFRDVPLFAAIAIRRFDCCIDFTQNDRSAILTLLSGAKKRIGASRVQLRSERRARVYNAFAELRLKEMHTIDYNLALLEPLGITTKSPPLRLDVPKNARAKAAELLRTAKIEIDPPAPASGAAGNHFVVVVHPGSARAEKFWEAERWARVIEHAHKDAGMRVVITGGSGRAEQEHIDAIKQRVGDLVVDLSGQTDLLTLAAVIECARVLLTVDSAAMHLAAAVGTPQVVLFGPTNPFHWRPRESPAIILQGESGVGLTTFVPKQARYSTTQISTQAVTNAMDSLPVPATAPPA